jgi:hypothetical protein
MSKVTTTDVCKYVAEFGENIFTSDGGILLINYMRLKSTVQSALLLHNT